MKCAIKHAGCYLSGFNPNVTYIESVRGIQTARHSGSEFYPVFQEEPKWFDPITIKGYMNLLIDYIRYSEKPEGYFAQYEFICKD